MCSVSKGLVGKDLEVSGYPGSVVILWPYGSGNNVAKEPPLEMA